MLKKVLFIILFISSFIFTSCEYFNNSAADYFEYWLGTVQVGAHEIKTPYKVINGQENISIEKDGQIEIYLYVINPKNYELLAREGVIPFALYDDKNNQIPNLTTTAISKDTIKITAQLDDSTHGKTLKLKGCLWPENILGISDIEKLQQTNPEIFYELSFIQNTPPDSVKNLKYSSNKLDSYYYYFIFDIPNQNMNKNQNVSYKIQTYERNVNTQQLLLIDEEIVSQNKNTLNNGKFYYYSSKQQENKEYEYCISVLGELGLYSEILSTDPGLGNSPVNDPDFSVNDTTKKNEEIIEGYETYVVSTKGTDCAQFVINQQSGVTYEMYLDGNFVNNENSITVPLGKHTIKVLSKKDKFETTTFEEKLYIQGQLIDPVFSYLNGSVNAVNKGNITYSGKQYKKYQFSYLNNDKLTVEIQNNNSDSNMIVKYNNISGSSSLSLDPDEYYTIQVKIEKENCIPLEVTEYIAPIIKPIKLSYTNGVDIMEAYCSGFNRSSNSYFYLRGNIFLFGNQIWGDWSGDGGNSDSCNKVLNNEWSRIKYKSNTYSEKTFTSVNQVDQLYYYQIRGHNKGTGNDDDDFNPNFENAIYETRSLKQIKKAYNSSNYRVGNKNWVFVTDEAVRNGNWKFKLTVELTATEVDD